MNNSQLNAPVVLLVEDDHSISDVYKFKLQISGYTVLTAYDGVEAVKILRSDHIIDLVLLDLILPKISGENVLEKMRSLSGRIDIPVIVLTNTGKEEAPRTLWHLGISKFVVKVDTTPKAMVELISASLQPV